MSNNYKVNINPIVPSKEKIDKSKNFDKLIQKHEMIYRPFEVRKKMHRKRNVIMLVVSLIAVGLALLFSMD